MGQVRDELIELRGLRFHYRDWAAERAAEADAPVLVDSTLIELSRDIAQLVTAGTRQDLFLIDYAADIVARDLSARWRINDRVTVGGRFYRYENDGSFALNLDDQRLFVDVGLTDTYLLHFGLRHIDHREDRFDDYDADLVELSLSMRW